MAAEVREGLLAPFPSLPCKYFYDDRGSALFEEITRLPEYYQTRTEEALLDADRGRGAGRTRPRGAGGAGLGRGAQDPRPARPARVAPGARALPPHGRQRALPARVGRRASIGLPGGQGARSAGRLHARPVGPRARAASACCCSSRGPWGTSTPTTCPRFFRRSAASARAGRRLPGRRGPRKGHDRGSRPPTTTPPGSRRGST